MNPAAQEFVPRKQRIDAPAPVHPSLHPSSPPSQQQQQTKLRASAPAFVPKVSALSAAPRPFQTNQPQQQQQQQPSPPQQKQQPQQQQKQQQQQPQPQNPPQSDAAAAAETVSPSGKTLSLSATPYTPTNPKVAAKFPVSPQPPPPPQPQPQPQQLESHRVASSAGSTSATDAGSGAAAEAVENDFSGSALPAAFDVPDVSAPAPGEPLRFNTMWALYADDHPTPFGVPLAYDPVLVHHVGDVETFWRLWRFLPPPSMLTPAFTYHWFRRDIKPNWEHARNKNGGTVTIVIFDRDKPGQNSKQTMDDAFMTMLIACCGETLAESSTTLNGMMLKVRQNKPTTVQLWTASSDQRKLKALAQSLRNLLEKIIGQKPLQKLEYFSHQQTQMGGPGSLAGRIKGKPSRMTPDFTL